MQALTIGATIVYDDFTSNLTIESWMGASERPPEVTMLSLPYPEPDVFVPHSPRPSQGSLETHNNM